MPVGGQTGVEDSIHEPSKAPLDGPRSSVKQDHMRTSVVTIDKNKEPEVSFLIDDNVIEGRKVLWRPDAFMVHTYPGNYKPYPLLKINLPWYSKKPTAHPWGKSVIPEVKLAPPVYPHPPDLSCFTTQATMMLAKYYEQHMRAGFRKLF